MISVILPIRNEERFIAKTLDSILSQSFDEEIEILIADGMSTDGTREIIKDYQDNHGSIHLIDNPEKIVSVGFNRALSLAKGDIIIRVDGHTSIYQEFFKKIIKNLIDKNCDSTGGLINPEGDSVISKIITIATSSKFGVGNSKFHYSKKSCWTETVYLGAYRRKVFDEIGGYDEELVRNQDDEFNFRLIQNGGKIWLDPSIKSSYTPRNSFIGLFKQYFQYGFYKVRVMQKRRGFASWRHLVPGLFVSSILLSFFIYFLNGNLFSFKLIFIPYIVISLGFTVIAFFKSPNKILSVFLLPFTFFILHFSYGLGFLSGLVWFWNKWGDTEVKDSHFVFEKFKSNFESKIL
ncbi:MAG: glycosyltransferase family 2 protein [Candidatus Marinimicrobia bacterium]|nr:glycosyltransferase family 2 protein [Candidatus Neomarinimicrobiota bacterium]MBT4578523.1 glycosyltransferase family 2 protein [Candidatus Neomarinimicrobiota bacterium]MBT5460706.1 glycosyltransferase family 2 protein [Candidatus Neomarinimicrobiota bacterium]MBT6862982.1 glycosyltransferase family 2 protein [Candidatus Neomarinimicrobiota bacterium]MBT7821882.1 glycosyltransferase family 2 protein [Candidatus Neomarinimicrobiota bacterium]